MGEFIELTASDGHVLKAYKAMPAGTPKGAIVVVQEIFGVNAHIRDMTERFASLGYVAIAPAMFDRYERDLDIGYSGEDRQKAFSFVPKLDMEKAALDALAAKQDVSGYGKTAITGFCFGGTVAFLGAVRLGFDASVAFYGGGVAHFATEPAKCPAMLHFGAKDDHIPLSVGETVKANSPASEVYTYPAGHAFMRDVDPNAYHKESADLAWGRTVEFLAKHIG